MASGLRAGTPSPWRGRLAQRRPDGAQLGRGSVDAAQPLGQSEGAFGLGAVGQEAARLSAYPAAGQAKAPLVAVGDGPTAFGGGLTA
jgi:hypothetical protein